jgi:ankyrin repeat protein
VERMLAFVNTNLVLQRSLKKSSESFCKQCCFQQRSLLSTKKFRQLRVRICVTNTLFCSFSEAPVDEIDETIKEAQGTELSRADSDLLKFALMGNIVGVQQALAAGAKAGVQDKEGRTALHLAAAIGVPSLCEILLQAAGDLAADCINSTDHLGLTPLHMAAGYCRISTVEYLLSWNPDVNIRNKDGYRPIDLVAKLIEREPKKTLFFVKNQRRAILQEIYDMLKPLSSE